jgi:hypothetical protein
MSALYICVAAWLALNAATFAILMLRPDRRDNDALGLLTTVVKGHPARNSR